ncbi:MAG: TIGR02594 family protein [Anaerolineales bacterium]|nr:TIGR02594 family protein [Anaerolineales bacterium]
MSTYIVTANALRIRKAPGKKTLDYLRRNAIVTGLEVSEDGAWIKIRTASGLEGWSAVKYLSAIDDPESPAGPDRGQYRVAVSSLYLREGPGENYEAINYLREDEPVTAIGSSSDGLWMQVRQASGQTGWCIREHLAFVHSDETSVEAPAVGGKYKVAASAIYVREGPGTNYKTAGYLHQDDIVTMYAISEDGSWMQVRGEDNLTGWCNASSLVSLEDTRKQAEKLDQSTGIHICTADILNIRKESGLDYAILGQLSNGEIVKVLEVSDDRLWKKLVTVAGLIGWGYSKSLEHLNLDLAPKSEEEFRWMLIALNEMGVRRVTGMSRKPRVMEYLKSTNLPAIPEETDWSAAFINWCLERANYQGARSAEIDPWKEWGQEVTVPRRGCVVIFRWENGKEHIAFYLGQSYESVFALGSNLRDVVWVKAYPKKHVLAYRLPAQ